MSSIGLDPATDRAIDEFSRSIRLSPVDPEIGYSLSGIAYAYILKGDCLKALDFARRSSREMPRWLGTWVSVAVAAANLGYKKEAEEAVRQILTLSPLYSMARRPNIFRDLKSSEIFSDGLRLAGIPE